MAFSKHSLTESMEVFAVVVIELFSTAILASSKVDLLEFAL